MATAGLVLVVTRDLVRPEDTVPLLRLAGSARPGRVDRNHADGDLGALPTRSRSSRSPPARSTC